MSISVVIPMEPRGKQRPRLANKGRFAKAYTPKQTKEWTAEARRWLRALWSGATIEAGVPVGVSITAVHKRPQRLQRKSSPAARMYKETKPDADNIAKIVLDSMNGIVFFDDCQVCEVKTIKLWCAKGEEPHVEVEVWRLPCYGDLG